MNTYRQWRHKKRMQKLEALGTNAATIYHYLSDPSHREIARALEMPKTTVTDAIKRLKTNGFTTGKWGLA